MQDRIAAVELFLVEQGKLLNSILDINLSPALGVHVLAQRASQKNELITLLVRKLWALKSMVTARELGYGLTRRLNQVQNNEQDESVHFECANNLEFSWAEAYNGLVAKECDRKPLWPLTLGKMLEVGHLIEDSAVIPLSELLVLLATDNKNQTACIKQVLLAFPVILVMKGNHNLLINIHEYNVQQDLLRIIFDPKDGC